MQGLKEEVHGAGQGATEIQKGKPRRRSTGMTKSLGRPTCDQLGLQKVPKGSQAFPAYSVGTVAYL